MIRGIIYYAIALFILALSVVLLNGCDSAKQQQKGWNKFIKYGGKVDTVERVVTVTDTIKGKDGRDSIVYRDVYVKCPEPTIQYKDRWHIRRMDRQEKDSLKRLYAHQEKMMKLRHAFVEDSLNKVIKLEKAKKKTAKAENNHGASRFIWALFFLILGILVLMYVINRIKSYIQ